MSLPWTLLRRLHCRSIPIIFGGTGNIPPANAVNYVPWTIVGFVFQYMIRRHHFSWWTKYNCKPHSLAFFRFSLRHVLDVLSAALDSGLAVGTVIIFFS